MTHVKTGHFCARQYFFKCSCDNRVIFKYWYSIILLSKSISIEYICASKNEHWTKSRGYCTVSLGCVSLKQCWIFLQQRCSNSFHLHREGESLNNDLRWHYIPSAGYILTVTTKFKSTRLSLRLRTYFWRKFPNLFDMF